jgi:hypothetical protein
MWLAAGLKCALPPATMGGFVLLKACPFGNIRQTAAIDPAGRGASNSRFSAEFIRRTSSPSTAGPVQYPAKLIDIVPSGW